MADPQPMPIAACDRCDYRTATEREFGRRCPQGSGSWTPCRGWMSDPRGGTAKAPKREDGTYWYVREHSQLGRRGRSLVTAPTLKDAKAKYGYTRENHASIRLWRATINEVAALERHA